MADGQLYNLSMSRSIVTADRTKLIAGPYQTPRCKVGRMLRCQIRGKVIVRGIHEAPIQWPYTLPPRGAAGPCSSCAAIWRERSA
jgi:hypothetical protein